MCSRDWEVQVAENKILGGDERLVGWFWPREASQGSELADDMVG